MTAPEKMRDVVQKENFGGTGDLWSCIQCC